MITQRIPTLASLLLLPLAIQTGLAATVSEFYVELRRTARSCGDAAPITGTHEG